MKVIKEWINDLMGVAGYHISRSPSLIRDIALGKYRWLQERGIHTILDIGASTGEFAKMMRQIAPEAMIYAFEPLASSYQELTENASSLVPIKCFRIALGKENAVVTMNHNDFPQSSSLLAMGKRHIDAFPFTQHSVEEKITVRRLDEVIADLPMKPPVLMKADVQGYELNVLIGAEKALPRIDMLILETSFEELYIGQPLFDDIYRFLREHGFAYAGSFDQIVDPSNGAILQADSIFTKI